MTVDELYLENIDEFVNDESKIVTYKWLSQTLKVHCNVAKQMLYKFIDTERHVKNKDGLNVTYFVSGLTKPDDHGEQAFKCAVVSEEKLGAYKTSFVTLTGCHVYSVQKLKLKDSNALYMTDYEKFKENVYESNKYSSIQYDKAVLRSQEDMELLTLNAVPPVEDKKPAISTTGGKGPTSKQPKSSLANMFAKQDTNKKATEKVMPDASGDKKTEKEADTKAPTKGGNKKPAGGMMAFFNKQTDKPADSVKKTEDKPTTKGKEDKKVADVKSKTAAKSKTDTAKSKKNQRQEVSDDEEVTRSKRRRIKPDILDSSSEEEMEAEEEEPIPPTPPRETTPSPPPREVTPEPDNKPHSPVVEIEDDETAEDPLPNKTSPDKKGESAKRSSSGERRRRRKRKLVSKTTMGADGFMETEKVYESESTDASEVEEPVKKVTKPAAKAKSPAKGKKGSPQKKSPNGKKGSAPSGKQTSMLSFFKKS